MSRLHIAIVPSWYPESPADVNGVFFRDQAIALRENGCRVTVLSPQRKSILSIGKGAFWRQPIYREDDEGVETYRKRMRAWFPLVPFANAYLWRRVANRMLERYVKVNGWPDVFHAHSALFAGWCCSRWQRRLGIRYVLTEHSTIFGATKLSSWRRMLAQEAVEHASRTIVVSPGLGEQLERVLGVHRSNFVWIPNVVDARFRYVKRSRYPGEPVRFLTVAVLTKRKGHEDLIRAFGHAFRAEGQSELIVAGDGPLMARLRKLTLQLGLEKRVAFVGHVSPQEVPALMEGCDVFVLPSHHETFGVVVAEALACGRPVIATKCGGPEWILGSGDGLLVPPNDYRALASAMQQLADQVDTTDGAGISERAAQRFGSQAVSEALCRQYSEVLRGRPDLCGR